MISLTADGCCAIVLGTMQDGGLPHAGCRCPNCTAAWNDPRKGGFVTSLALVEKQGEQTSVFLIDATPDIKFQLNLLAPILGEHPQRPGRLRQPDGILLTHAHMGHIAGLPQLSMEGMFVNRLPLYASQPMREHLEGMILWRPLLEQLDFNPLVEQKTINLTENLALTPIPVPHRDEWGVGTFAFKVQGAERSLLYLPDIDSWEKWGEAEEVLRGVDSALVDGSFFSTAELGGRPPVAHPLIPDTLNRWGGLDTALVFTHFNHTNPLLRDGEERAQVTAAGGRLAETGMVFPL